VVQPRRLPLDDIDHRLLELLQENAGRTLRELGALVSLSPSAVQRRITRYDTSGLIGRRTAVLDPAAIGDVLLAVVLVALEPGSAESHAALRERLLTAPEVQQSYDVAGEWDYVVVLATGGMSHCRELVDRLFVSDPDIGRFATLPVFDAIKTGLAIPTQLTEVR
jgi:DNA-binding Lrp family transcriptional regulator